LSETHGLSVREPRLSRRYFLTSGRIRFLTNARPTGEGWSLTNARPVEVEGWSLIGLDIIKIFP